MRGSQSIVVYGQAVKAHAYVTGEYVRTDARFLAHLIAVRGNHPDVRLKNRAAPEYGVAAYRQSDMFGHNRNTPSLGRVA